MSLQTGENRTTQICIYCSLNTSWCEDGVDEDEASRRTAETRDTAGTSGGAAADRLFIMEGKTPPDQNASSGD